MFCPKCGNKNDDGTRFCSSCGAPLEQQAPQQPNYQQPNYQQPNYQQPNYQQPPYGQPQYAGTGSYKAPIKNRGLALCIILSIITCGIYGIIWMVGMADDLNTASNRTGDTNGITVFLLSLVTCGIYGIFWAYKAGEKVDLIRGYNGEAPSNSAILYLILSLLGFGIITYCLIQNELNKVATLQ